MTKPISIQAFVDVVGALATGDLSGNLYLLDTSGSRGIGTEALKTVVRKVDELFWTVLPLECEAYACIQDIEIDLEVCEPEMRIYPGTDVSYWVGTVKKDVEAAPYRLALLLGTRTTPLTSAATPALVGGAR